MRDVRWFGHLVNTRILSEQRQTHILAEEYEQRLGRCQAVWTRSAKVPAKTGGCLQP